MTDLFSILVGLPFLCPYKCIHLVCSFLNLSSFIWLLFLRSIHIFVNINSQHLSVVAWHPTVCMHYHLLIHLSVEGQLGCFPVFGNWENTGINIWVQMLCGHRFSFHLVKNPESDCYIIWYLFDIIKTAKCLVLSVIFIAYKPWYLWRMPTYLERVNIFIDFLLFD